MSSDGVVHFYSEKYTSVRDIGQFLINIGEKLANEGSFNLQQDQQELSVSPSGSPKLEVKYKTKQGKHEFEIEIEWRPDSGDVIIK